MKRLTVDDYKAAVTNTEKSYGDYIRVVESWQQAFIKNEDNPSMCSLVKVLPDVTIKDYKSNTFGTRVRLVLHGDYDGDSQMCTSFSIPECQKLVDILQDIIKSSTELDAYVESTKGLEKK